MSTFDIREDVFVKMVRATLPLTCPVEIATMKAWDIADDSTNMHVRIKADGQTLNYKFNTDPEKRAEELGKLHEALVDFTYRIWAKGMTCKEALRGYPELEL